jgi:CheY-like chemotaxis protein/two-component sensor histidine kinase
LSRLETAVREREQFLATMSHELRNPLAAIRTSTELLLRALPPGERIQRLMAVLDRQSRHLGRLVDDLLEVSRVTTGKVILSRQRIDLRAVMDNVLQQLGPVIEEEGLALSCVLGSAPCQVDGDPVRLEQIFTNLLTNAIKYTPRGGRVSVTLQSSGELAEVKVADTGVGMSPETLRSVFDLFSQADRSLDRARGGMGIGLTLVRALTELHGGSVRAASGGLGQGSELTVALPLAAAVVTEPGDEPLPDAGPVPPQRILIVEDSPDNREVLQELLEQEGHRVETAPDGPIALQVALRSRPEVSLIDIGLPGMDGYELARRLRAALGDAILLVALTGYGRTEDRQRSAEAGFDCHLTKPLAMEKLRHVLWNRAVGSGGLRPS